MAFTVSNQQCQGVGGGLKMTTFTFTGSSGDAAGTVTVTAGLILHVSASARDAAGVWQSIPCSDAAGTADGTRTVTFYTHDSVTLGGGIILHK